MRPVIVAMVVLLPAPFGQAGALGAYAKRPLPAWVHTAVIAAVAAPPGAN